MKKFILLLSIVFISVSIIAQDELKSWRMGLHLNPSLDWYSPANKRKLESDGLRFGFGIGFVAERRLSDNISLQTGIQINFGMTGKLKQIDDNAYYGISDDYDLIKIEEFNKVEDAKKAQLKIDEGNVRTFGNTYISLPIALKMSTNEIGYLRYYGIVGLRANILTRSRISDDKVSNFNPALYTADVNTDDIEDINNLKDMNTFMLQAQFGIGAGYSLSGSTSAFLTIKYNYGITNPLNKSSNFIHPLNSNNGFSQKILSHGLTFSMGILF